MIRFLFLIILSFLVYLYLKHFEHHPYFFIVEVDTEYNLIELNFLNLNKKEYIERNSIIVLKEDVSDLMNILEDCYLNNIKFDVEGNEMFF